MRSLPLSPLGAACLPVYFAVALLIGWLSRPRRGTSAGSFLNASRSLPLPLVVAAFLAANCGALEVVGLSAMAAQYGAIAFHFYWIGAIPAMVCLGLYVLPVYRASGVTSVPRYLGVRYGEGLATLNAGAISLSMLLLSGISLYAMAQVLQVLLHLRFGVGVLISAAVVLSYVLLGGVRATMYTEVFQLCVMVAGLLPLCLRSSLLLRNAPSGVRALNHAWATMPFVATQAPMDGVGLTLGLGLVLSFGYWCTDFVLMQRAFTARTELQARTVPLWAGFGKLFFGFLVVLPGLAAARLPIEKGLHRYDQSLPALMTHLYGPSLLGLGLTALTASLMSGLAANVSGFSAIWTEDLYRRHYQSNRPEAHYLRVGRLASVLAVVVGICCSVLSFRFNNLMEHVQLIFALLNAPFWAVFLLGIGTRWVTERAASAGFLFGVLVGGLHTWAVGHGWLHYGSRMSSAFYSAIYAFLGAVLLSVILSAPRTARRSWSSSQDGTVTTPRFTFSQLSFWECGLALLLLLTCIVLNWIWW